MISSTGFAFVILPCIGAVMIAALLRDWRLAAAATFGSLGIIFVLPALPTTVALFSLPFFAGTALGALTTTIALYMRRDIDVWARMIRALIVGFIATFANLLAFANGA